MIKRILLVLISSLMVIIIFALSDLTYGQENSPLFSIERLVVAEDIRNREPVGIKETFPATTEMVYCFLETKNVKEDTWITFNWYYEGKKIHSYEMPLKNGDRWRTFAYKNLYGQRGRWEVEIKDSAGNTVKTISFKVE